jgi:hypothetical protein
LLIGQRSFDVLEGCLCMYFDVDTVQRDDRLGTLYTHQA